MPVRLTHTIAHDDNTPIENPTVALQAVSVRYGAATALDAVTLQVWRGDHVAVVGPNGAGKSTLFNLIAGIIQPTQGQVHVYGGGPNRHSRVGYVPQRNHTDWRFPVTVSDVVMMGRTSKIGLFRWAQGHDRETVQEALRQVGMQAFAKRQIGELSGGQQQRVFLARALAQEAELLLLDEPLSGLDTPSQEAILTILGVLRAKGVTTLVATHDLNQAATHFPLILLLNRRLIAYGPPDQVLTPAILGAAYGSQMHVVQTRQGEVIVTDSCCDGGEVVGTVTGNR